MKTKILNLGTVINKTAQKQILGGESPMRCPIGYFYYCTPRKTHCYCKLEFLDNSKELMEII